MTLIFRIFLRQLVRITVVTNAAKPQMNTQFDAKFNSDKDPPLLHPHTASTAV